MYSLPSGPNRIRPPLGATARPSGLAESVARVFTAPIPPPPPLVVAWAALLGAERLPARSRARTVNVNVVLAARLPTVAVVVVSSVEATGVAPPFWYTSYPASPTPPALSVDAFHASVTVLPVCPVECRLPGTLGGVLSV